MELPNLRVPFSSARGHPARAASTDMTQDPARFIPDLIQVRI